jgi:hypothetical protein
MIGQAEKGAEPMSDSHRLGFTRAFLEACTDLKLIELQDLLLRERPEDRRDDLHAVSEELAKRQNKAHHADPSLAQPLANGCAPLGVPVTDQDAGLAFGIRMIFRA